MTQTNTLEFKPWAYEQTGSDGKVYGLVTLCPVEAKNQLQKVGILPADVCEVVGLQTAVDTQVAMLEREAGVVLQ